MTTSLPRLLTATGVALALLAPAAAQAQTETDLPVGEARGVRLVRADGGALVLIFSDRAAKLRKRINSRYAWLSCTHLGELFSSSGSGNVDASGHSRVLRTGFHPGPSDYCRFFIRAHTVKRKGERRRISRRVLFNIPLTQPGAVFLDEEAKTGDMFIVDLFAAFAKDRQDLAGAPPTPSSSRLTPS